MKRITDQWWINFNGGSATVCGKEIDGTYTVKWFLNDEFRGQYDLGPGRWGAYPLELGNWRMEFWKAGSLSSEYDNNLSGENILIIAEFNNLQPGKNLPIGELINRAKNIKEQWGCEPILYFKGSERYNLSPFKTLKMNDEYDFKIILEENYG